MDTLRSIWNQMPAVRLLLPFIAGIGLCIGFGAAVVPFSVLLAVCIVLLIYINQLTSAAKVYKWRFISGIAISIAMLSLGYVVTYVNTDRNDPHHIAHVTSDEATYEGMVTEPPVIKEKSVNTLIELRTIKQNDLSKNVSGKVLANIKRSAASEVLKYGDRIIFTGEVAEYDEPKNPDQFNYKQYQSLHHIYHHIYLKPDGWILSDIKEGNPILIKVYQLRSYFLSLIKREVSDANALAVATAIMLGYRDYVTDDVTQAYAGSGVLHVLSVSGLHVAVLYFVLNMLLGWMDRRRKLQIIKGVLVIIIMLFYAGLTGLSPPVLRSVWMFTLITIAILLDRDVSMYNVLGVSCLLLLLWDPYYIADVGFQLSYIAVAGIVYLYPMISGIMTDTDISITKVRWLDTSVNWLTRWTWGLICLSIAAQIATFPISLFYFHSFPNYFLLSNLLVIPLSNFVLIAGMGLFMVGWSDRLSHCIGWVFDHLLLALNKVVFGIDILPHALSTGIVITSFEMIMLYIAIALICIYITGKRARVLIAALCMLLVVCTAFSIDNIKNQNRKELVVYCVYGKKAISIIDRNTVYYDLDSALLNNEMLMRYNVRDHWYVAGVKKQLPIDSVKGICMFPDGKIFEAGGKKIVVIDGVGWHGRSGRSPMDQPQAENKLKADIIILSNTACHIQDIADEFTFSKIVFDTSCKKWRIKKWKEECDAFHIIYHDCQEKAFVMEL